MKDALRRAPDASYEAALGRGPLDGHRQRLAGAMIGRPLRARSAAAVRCGWGLPAVLRVDPQLPDGAPFPTLFWLACPLAVRAVGRLEAAGWMRELADRLGGDPLIAQAYAAAHDRYVAARNRLGPAVPRNPSAGGMPDRVKCLHSLYAHHLATGDNPLGAMVARQVEPLACPAPCVGPDAAAAAP
jgi:hypothetical protein